MHPDDIEKTAVITPFGLYEYTVMAYGLRNAAPTFQRYADAALGDLPFLFVYIDDIFIAPDSIDSHEKHRSGAPKKIRFAAQTRGMLVGPARSKIFRF